MSRSSLTRTPRSFVLASLVASLAACGGGSTQPSGWASHTLTDQTYALGVSSTNVIASMLWLGDTIKFRRASNGTLIRSVAITETPIHGVFNADGTIFYVVCQSSNEVGRINVLNGTYTKTNVGHPTYNIAMSESGSSVYVTTADGLVYALNATTLAKVDSVNLGGGAGSNGIAARGGQLWVSTFEGKLFRLSPTTLAKMDSVVRSGRIQRVVLNAGATTLYAVEEDSARILTVNTASKALNSAPLSGLGIGAALDEQDDQIWVTSRTTGVVQMFDASSLALLDSLVIGGTPRDVTFAPDGQTAVIGAEDFSFRLRR